MQLSLFSNAENKNLPEGFSLEAVFAAYFSCRSNKRNTINALVFELDYESNLIQLWKELNDGSYQPGKSIAFIVHKPVQREIFAADFRDRVVHHLIINKLNHLFEKEFIYDSFGCRINKGTHFGINRVDTFIRKCSKNVSVLGITSSIRSYYFRALPLKQRKMRNRKSYCSTDILNHLQNQRKSNQTVSFYCAEHDLKTMTFYKWRSRHKAKSTSSVNEFIELPIELNSHDALVEIELLSGATVRFYQGATSSLINKVISSL